MMRSPVIVAALAGLVALAGCTNFPREDRVEDMRVLAVKTEPAEILYSPLFLTRPDQRPPGFPLPTVDVSVEVFALDPRGGHIETTTLFCPAGVSDSTCRLYDPSADIAAEPPAAQAELRDFLTPRHEESDILAETTPVGRVLPATYTLSITPAVMDFIIPDASNGDPVPSIFPLTPRFVVQEKNTDVPAQDAAERAFKRIPMALDLTSPDLPADVIGNLANALGITLCTEPIPEEEFLKQGRAECLLTRTPNQNPALLGFHIENQFDPNLLTPDVVTPEKASVDIGIGSVLGVHPGDSIAVTPVFADGTDEHYQVVSFDIASSKVILLNRVEDLACNWYSTRGDTGGSLTALQFGPTLGNVWTTPADAQPGERDSLVLVVLDQRGGTAFGEITVVYE